MALARRVLTVLIAVALAFVPVIGATAGHRALTTTQMGTSAGPGRVMLHDHASMQKTVANAAPRDTSDCHGKAADRKCCHDEGTCAQTCLQKCFSQIAVLLPERSPRPMLVRQFASLAAVELPGRSLTPQPPPPRA